MANSPDHYLKLLVFDLLLSRLAVAMAEHDTLREELAAVRADLAAYDAKAKPRRKRRRPKKDVTPHG